jgi:hypothetical protein
LGQGALGVIRKKGLQKLLRITARSIGEGRSRKDRKFFASFFQKRSPSFPVLLPQVVAPPAPKPSPKLGEGGHWQLVLFFKKEELSSYG